jgi:hypothetical protein
MTKQTEALEMAINVLELYEEKLNSSIAIEVIQICKEALAEQPTNMVTVPLDKLEDMQRKVKSYEESFNDVHLKSTQEPVLYIDGGGLDGHATWAQAIRCQDTDIALYTHPKQWQGLTAKEISSIPLNEHTVQAVENLLRGKNG